jgi:O-antigen/teichoic acid export membrane protein
MGAVATRAHAVLPVTWRPVVRAMSQTGVASLASGLLTAIATKILAVLLGPAQVALLATLQQMRQAALTGATLNGQTALIQGASALTGSARLAYLRTVLILMSAATGGVALAMVIAPVWFGGLAGLGPEKAPLVRWLALAVILSSGFAFLAARLNVLGSLGSLAAIQLAGPATMAILAYPTAMIVRSGRSQVFPLLLIAAAGASLSAVFVALRGRSHLRGSGPWWNYPDARRFLTISGSMLASGLVSSAVLVAIRARILRSEGLTATGQFDAAWAISMSQVSLVLASLQTYYLPALARADQLKERNVHIAQVLTAAVLVGAPLIAAIAVFKPLVLTLFYSAAFRGGEQYLRWTLLGDYLKLTSWIFSIPMLAAADLRSFLTADLAAYGTFALGAVVLARSGSAAEAAAMAFVLMYAVHLVVCAGYAWRHQFRLDLRTGLVWTGGLLLISVVSAVCWSSR